LGQTILKLVPIYNTIGTGYNSTRQADPSLTGRLLYFLNPGQGKTYLDIGCGTGNYTIALAKHGLNFTGVEPSEKMLEVARKKEANINWLHGSAENIPAKSRTFDGVIATLTIHHWQHLDRALNEIARVTKEHGTAVFFTATSEQIAGYWLNHYFPQMLRSSTIQMPSFYVIADALTNAGFKIKTTEKYFVPDGLQDYFLYAGKHRPEIYFDNDIRKGISSFAALANANEVEAGLLKLKADLQNGKFLEIKEKYDNDLGDYLFIVAEK
jgi:SAM-dependent methyltransferase